jgi:hypothetical protein
MWRHADLTVVTGLDVMRRRPEMYMPEGVNPAGIAARLMSDSMLLGAQQVRTDVVGAWHIVSADVDWLTAPTRLKVSVPELFQRLVVFEEGGPNAVRAEAWVGAYCRSAHAVTAVERLSVVGGDALTPDVEAALLPVGCIRSVAFCMAANNALERARDG